MLAARVPISPELHARLAGIVARVRVREVHRVDDLMARDMRNTPMSTGQAGRLVEMDVAEVLKSSHMWGSWSDLSTIVAVVPDVLDPARVMPDLGLQDLFAVGTESFAFVGVYGGPGDHDCRSISEAAGSVQGRATCGFVLPYLIEGDRVLDPLSGERLPRAAFEAAVARAARSREPATPNPPPQWMSHRILDGIYMDVADAIDLKGLVVAEVEVVREGPLEYNTQSGAAPPAPPDAPGRPHIDREEWDIRAVVELKVHHVFAGDAASTDIVTLAEGNPDNPYHSTTGMELPALPIGMRGIVAFDEQRWPTGDPTHYQRRALARVAALTKAGRSARDLRLMPYAGVHFVGPYAMGDIDRLWLIPDSRAHLEGVAREVRR